MTTYMRNDPGIVRSYQRKQRAENPNPAIQPNVDIDEGYWDALLQEGEFARGVEMQPAAPGESLELDGQHADPAITAQSPPTDFSAGDWEKIHQIMEQDEILTLKIIGYNRGGLLVEWRSLRGFVPASQLVSLVPDETDNHRHDALVERVGDRLQLRVIELDAEKNRLILSERAAQVESGERSRLLHELQYGDTIRGRVTNLCDFGAFVDLGGVEGLIHISELSWGRVGHPADVLRRDQHVRVFVLDVDPDAARVALSMKRLHPDPWATVGERYAIGEVVKGRITNVVDFGAFACIEDGLEGLIHFSELAEGHFLHPRNVVEEGQVVQARILSIDGGARRLGLSLRLL
jgi:small subunit ribosomal protein S1